MEVISLPKTLSSNNKQIKSNPKRKTQYNNKTTNHNHHHHHHPHNPISRLASSMDENYAQPQQEMDMMMMKMMMMHGHHGGVFLNNPHNSFLRSYSLPTNYPFHPPINNHHRPPPLLPLPTAFRSLPPPTRHPSSSHPFTNTSIKKQPNNKKTNTSGKNTNTNNPTKEKVVATKAVTPNKKVGSDPGSHLKEDPVSSGSIFSLSPPPSSLPVPKFALIGRPKLSCTMEAAEVEDGVAADTLCRVLKLR